ncbi:phage minor head protein [Streptosporangium sp. NPDC023963]|uniref:phage minor head protein n=1 Tax=Streptosporangium sp. NPDC023963 TaxID=3155608 RepID=UPI003416EEF8
MADDVRAGQRADVTRALAGLEPMVERVVREALDQVADRYAASLRAAAVTVEDLAVLVAQGEPVDDADARRVADLWAAVIAFILLALLTVFGAAIVAARRALDAPADRSNGRSDDTRGEPGGPDQPAPAEQAQEPDRPGEVSDLVDVYLHRPLELPDAVRAYLSAAENRLRDVGDSLWQAARQALADGVAAGDTMAGLRARLHATFAEGGAQLGEARAARIARTETLAAWNWAQLHVARSQPGDSRPLYKSWLATLDLRTRDEHFRADGQTVALDADFQVGGELLDFPGDPTASASNVVNCRCSMTFHDQADPPADDEGRQGLSTREINDIVRAFEERGIVRDSHISAASGGPYTGGMIALVPSQADLDRLAVDGGELREDLHLTLLFLGDVSDIAPEQRAEIIDQVRGVVARLSDEQQVDLPIWGDAFAISAFNPAASDRDTCIVVGVGGSDLASVRQAVASTVGDVFTYPDQHAPWVPHVTLTYTDDLAQVADLADRTGPITFDRLRVAFAGDVVDLPLGKSATEGETMPDQDLPAAAVPSPRRWSTPGDTALAFENQETGDGRIFAPRSLYWDGDSWPLQYADEMQGGHKGAILAGAIQQVSRDGGRIPGSGVIYPNMEAGAAALQALEQGAPLGVSVDLDDVDMEFIDRRPAPERAAEDDGVILLASLKAASVMQLPDGAWSIRATQVVEWTTGDQGSMSGDGLKAALTAAGILTAAAGDNDTKSGEVLFSEASGDFVMRITKARLRGATLVTMPAFAQARITLDPVEATGPGLAASDCEECDAAEPQELLDPLTASAWHELQAMPPLPSAWFREPTAEELPPGSGGVHYADGRVYGWVAQAGVPHEAFPGRKLTVESLGELDLTTFLRARFQLDDGSTVRVGAMTMNAGHHRDGAECETASCQFDDTRTVAAVITVGMSKRGLWFSGAAAPWLSDWDRMVFQACQPSYHMRQNPNGQWSLRAVLSVPVPGHPSRLAASAVVGRSNLALTAAAAPLPAALAPDIDYERLAAALAPAVVDEMERREAARAEIKALSAELAPVRAELAQGLAVTVKAA